MSRKNFQSRTIKLVLLIIALFCAITLKRDSVTQAARQLPTPAQANNQANNQADNQPALEKNQPLTRDLKGGDSHSYTLNIAANHYLEAEVIQQGIDVKVMVTAPDGKKIYEVDRVNGKKGSEPITFITESSGDHQLVVVCDDKQSPAGQYQIRLYDVTAATDRLRELLHARHLNAQFERLYAKGKFDDALPLAEQILAIREKHLEPEHPDIGISLNNLAVLYRAKGDYSKAEPLYQRALAIKEKSLGPEHPSVATSLNSLAELYRDKGDLEKSLTLHQRALAIREKALGPDHPDVANSLTNLAGLYRARDDYAKALLLYKRALTIRMKVFGPEHVTVANSLGNLGPLYRLLGDYDKAEAVLQRALAIREKIAGADHPDVAIALNSLALIYDNKGEFARAEPLNLRALAIREKAFGLEHPNVAESLINLAALYRVKGNYPKAEALYQRALAIYEKALGAQHPLVALVLNNLAVLYKVQQQYEKAETFAERVLEINEKVLGANNPNLASSFNNLADIYRGQKKYQKAEALYQKALTLIENVLGKEHPDIAVSLNNLAQLYFSRGQYDKAISLHQRSLAISEKALGPTHPFLGTVLTDLSQCYRAQGELTQAIEYRARAGEARERDLLTNLSVGSESEKLNYIDLSMNELYQTISLHLLSAPTDQRAAQLAFTEILRRKGRALDFMADNIANLRRRASADDEKLLTELAEARAQYARLALRGPGKDSIEQYQINLKTQEKQMDLLEKQVSIRSHEFRVQAQPITLAAVQQAIPTDAVLVEFVVYKQFDQKDNLLAAHFVAYLLAHTGEPRAVDLGDINPIYDAIKTLNRYLRKESSNIEREVKPAARALDQLVMQPVRKLLGDKKRLLISPDGALNLVSFDALVDEQNRYLVENYEISYLTSGRDLLRLLTSVLSKQSPVIMADPDFADGPGPKIGDELFQPLPRLKGTIDEANQISSLLTEARLLTQSQATKAALLAISRPSILHLATHGYFLGNEAYEFDQGQRIAVRVKHAANDSSGVKLANPLLLSGLFFANANSKGADSTLTALEAAGLDLWGTKLVVLSGCDTGVGEVKFGDGIYGLRRALALAGSETQLMSLWPVSDQGTRDLMIGYYKSLNKNEGRSTGLRRVRLALLQRPERAHPYYWASFIQSGEWANLSGKR